MISGEERARYHEQLDSLLDYRNEDDDYFLSRYSSQRVMNAGLKLLAGLLGEKFVSSFPINDVVYDGSLVDEQLLAFALRIEALAPIIDREGVTPTTLVVEELTAIAHGDAPLLLARRASTGPAHAYRMAHWKLSALVWNMVLEEDGVSLAKRQAWLAEAYGTPWDTISRWDKQVGQYLGYERVAKDVKRFQHRRKVARLDPDYVEPTEEATRLAVMKNGAAYKKEQGFNV